jgi:hypothetical protein
MGRRLWRSHGCEFDTWMTGDHVVDMESLLVADVRYPYTNGFFDLLVMKHPDMNTIKSNDMTEYKRIISQTGAHLNRLGNIKRNVSKNIKQLSIGFFHQSRQ